MPFNCIILCIYNMVSLTLSRKDLRLDLLSFRVEGMCLQFEKTKETIDRELPICSRAERMSASGMLSKYVALLLMELQASSEMVAISSSG